MEFKLLLSSNASIEKTEVDMDDMAGGCTPEV
jgi:hypothetical protein